MLSEISIRNVVLIETLDLELGAGLTAMTGETGAGKSIILDALGMATGARSDKGLVRAGADKAQCSARFVLPKHHEVWNLLDAAGFEPDRADDLVLRRIITADGRSRAYINDAPAGQKLLAQIGLHVLEVHGQHDGRGLLDSATHRDLLDRFGNCLDLRTKCGSAYADMKQARETVEELQAKQAKSDDDRAFFEHAIAELDRLAPRAGEDEALASERRLLQHGEGALSELAGAQQALGDDGAYEARVGQALAGLERVRAKIGGESDNAAGLALQSATAALEKALIELEEARGAVNAAAQMFDFEPGQLDKIEERLFSLRAVARKYSVDVNGLADLRQSFGDDLLALERSDEDMAAAVKNLDTSRAVYNKIADALSRARTKSAKQLDDKVMVELPSLKMPNASFKTVINEAQDGPLGRDHIVFEVSTNPGNPAGLLNKVASGGELARFALAIKVALAGASDMVMIFDEVDQGVGGAVADAVGRRLSALAADDGAQVLVVTHSPQVAASADHQLLIHKSSVGGKTLTSVDPLNAQEREEEIARMLAGESVTDAARAAARQLMQAS